jgi:serine protease Do
MPLLIGLGLFSPAFGQQAPQQPPAADQQAQPTQVAEKPSAVADPTQTVSPSEISRAFINAAKRVKPTVVHIMVGTRGANGSGVIVSPDGYILTNNHVASAAYELRVKLSDGRQFTARRIGVDPRADLALIKVEAQNLPCATLGDSSKLEQGEWVIALGSPFGLEQTMTAGIVSAIGRKFGGPYDNFIQTDASINPGNSGGALVNMNGEVIGINSSIYSKGGGSEGVGFSIPSNIARQIKDNLLRNSRGARAYAGAGQ